MKGFRALRRPVSGFAILLIGFGVVLMSALATSAQDKGTLFGWLEVHASYSTTITVNGKPYPRRSEHGMMLNAEKRHEVLVKDGDKEKLYTVVLKPREKRILLVDISGFNSPPSPAAKPATSPKPSTKVKKEEDDDGEQGKLTVYSKPKGEVFVDGSALGATTPMINRQLEVGRHEVQVKWDDGRMSEIKTIRIRKGSKLKLFFRDRDKKK